MDGSVGAVRLGPKETVSLFFEKNSLKAGMVAAEILPKSRSSDPEMHMPGYAVCVTWKGANQSKSSKPNLSRVFVFSTQQEAADCVELLTIPARAPAPGI